jgi:hypothetical protein
MAAGIRVWDPKSSILFNESMVIILDFTLRFPNPFEGIKFGLSACVWMVYFNSEF